MLSPLPCLLEHDAPARSKSISDLLSVWWECRDEFCNSMHVIFGPMDVYAVGDTARVCIHCGTFTRGSSLAAWIAMHFKVSSAIVST